MRNFKNLTAMAASALVLGFAASANAAVFVETPGVGGGLISTDGAVIEADSGVEFINNELNLAGDFIVDNNTASVVVGAGVTRVELDFDVDQARPNGTRARGIQNFSLMVMGDMGTTFSLTGITDADGFLQIPTINSFAVMAGETLTFVFDGTAFANDTQFTPGYSVGAFGISEVPVPAAGLLFGTAALGGALARRKRKAA